MTETEWLTTSRPWDMLQEPTLQFSERKAILAGCHGLRRAWEMLSEVQRRYVDAMAQLADEQGTEEDCHRLRNEVFQEQLSAPDRPGAEIMYHAIRFLHPYQITRFGFGEVFRIQNNNDPFAKNDWQCRLIREVFGNPFRPVDFAPWRTDATVALARQMYELNDFSAMPILADALEDAGCVNVSVLDHCRDPGEHVRGCWVIDTLLGQ